jgi:3-oxoacyl-[acyl-carrier protein] reductase
VELGPVLALVEAAKRSDTRTSLSLVLLTSVAGLSTHPDLTLSYHILKSATLTTTRFLAVDGGKYGLRANSLILGEFEKYSRDSYTEKEQSKFGLVEQFTPTRKISTKAHIAATIEFLLSENSANMTGQSLSLDGHLSGLSPESILRQISQASHIP